MSERESLRFLGRPDVRNAILLGEVGVLIHDLGKVSAEYVSGEESFHTHLILRRLTRSQDTCLGPEASPWWAVVHNLKVANLDPEERVVADTICGQIADGGHGDASGSEISSQALETVLGSVRDTLSAHSQWAFERVAQLARQTWFALEWQMEQEKAIEALEPPFIGVEGFYDGLDQLASVADLLEMGGRTWRPMESQPPEVRLLNAIHGGGEVTDSLRSRCDLGRLADVRHLWCEVLANQFLEINNIRKDGPGDLGSWFWKSRLDAGGEAGFALLRDYDDGAMLSGEQREAVVWLGVRLISRWACSKIVLSADNDGVPTSLWDHCWILSGLYKSSIAQALLSGEWPEGDDLVWYRLRVGLLKEDPAVLTAIRELIEVEYPLGNELFRTDVEAHFTFPGLDSRLAANLVGELELEIGRLLGRGACPELHLSPLSREGAHRLACRSAF
jgi:hypothetical protein